MKFLADLIRNAWWVIEEWVWVPYTPIEHPIFIFIVFYANLPLGSTLLEHLHITDQLSALQVHHWSTSGPEPSVKHPYSFSLLTPSPAAMTSLSVSWKSALVGKQIGITSKSKLFQSRKERPAESDQMGEETVLQCRGPSGTWEDRLQCDCERTLSSCGR